MRTALIVLLVACGSSGSAGWSDKPLSESFTGKVNGVAFTLKLPAGMKGEMAQDIAMTWRADRKDYFSEPSVMVSYDAIPAKSADELVRDQMLDKHDVVIEKTATTDGFLVTSHTDNFGILRVIQTKTKGGKHLSCLASQATQGGVPSPEKTLAWLAQLCSTLEIQ